MSQKLVDAASSMGLLGTILSLEEAKDILENAPFGGIGIPRMVNEKTLLGGESHV